MAIAVGILILIVALAAILGPRVSADTTIRFDENSIGNDPDAYLAEREAEFGNIRDGLAKEIIWADPASRARTPFSIVYVHGFSASKGELRPLPDMVASALGANLFFSRLAGHGQDGAAMANASVNDWVNDLAEALAIGRAIGDRVVVMATSTGAGLVTWAATRPELGGDIAALVLVSPNYRVRAAGSQFLTWPWGGQLARLLAGPEQGFRPTGELQSRLWTWRYPTAAILPMAAAVRMGRDAPVEEVALPAMFVFSDRDRVVDPAATRNVISRWGGPHEMMIVDDSGDPNNHVIAGDAYSPSTTEAVGQRVIDWLASLPD